MYRIVSWTLWEKARVGCFKRTASKHVYYLGWNRSPAQVGCMRQVLGPGALGRPRGIGWRGRWEGGIGMGNTCKPMAVSFQCMTKSTTRKKKEEEKKLKLTGKKKTNTKCYLAALLCTPNSCWCENTYSLQEHPTRKSSSSSCMYPAAKPWESKTSRELDFVCKLRKYHPLKWNLTGRRINGWGVE